MKTQCPNCKTEFDIKVGEIGKNRKCGNCQKDFIIKVEHDIVDKILFEEDNDLLSATEDKKPICQSCGGKLSRVTLRSSRTARIWGCVLFLLGVILCLVALFTFWLIFLVGVIFITIAIFFGGEERKVLKCSDCGQILDRD